MNPLFQPFVEGTDFTLCPFAHGNLMLEPCVDLLEVGGALSYPVFKVDAVFFYLCDGQAESC